MPKTDDDEIKLSKKQTLFTAIVMITSLLGTFALGVFVGVRYTQSKKSAESTPSAADTLVKTLPPADIPVDSPKPAQTEGEKNATQFTFYDTLLKNSEAQLESEKQRDVIKEVTPPAPHKVEKVEELSQDNVRKKYTIQLGSFQQKEKAHALQNQLKKQGFLAYVITEKLPERGTWYRVKMGKFDTPEEAQQWIAKLGDLSPPPFITYATD
jgi:cell division septation protein DedD